MGCSESAAIAEKPLKKEEPKLEPAPKPKGEQSPHFLIGHISEEEYLFARVSLTNRSIDRLTIPKDFRPFNFSSMLSLPNKQYFISGGINFTLNDITPECHLYDSQTHTIKKLAPMSQARYTHACLLFKNQIYVIGGRFFGEDEIAIMNSCQIYDLEKNKWKTIAGLNVKRCTCYALSWKDAVYVFGGYTGEFERSQKIEKYQTDNNQWEIVDFQLNRGIQSCFVMSKHPNQVTVFGGNTNSGPTASVVTLNLETQSVISHKHLKEPKMLHKSFVMDELVFIFGGSQTGDLQIYNTSKNTSDIIHLKLFEQFPPQILQSLTMSQKPLQVSHQKELPEVEQGEGDDLILTFGTTEQPFILQLNVSIPSSKVLPVPLSLKLFAEAGGVQLSSFTYFLFGGIEDDSLSSVTSACYIYNHKLKTAKKTMNMLTPRYSFSYQKIQNRVYAIGGGINDPDGNLIILDSCEYYDLQKQTWNSLCNLPIPLISSMSLAYDNQLYVFGGLTEQKKRSKNVYKYDQSKDSWSQLKFHFPFGIQAAAVFHYKPNEFYIFGGRIDNGDTDKIFDLVFTKQGETECGFFQKGQMGEQKNNVKVFQPKNQDFIVCLGGDQQPVSYFELESLKSMEWDGLRRLKEVFTTQIQDLNSPKMNSYLTISQSRFNK